jgi:hypothetical protein
VIAIEDRALILMLRPKLAPAHARREPSSGD